MTRAYLRLDPGFDEHKHAYPDGPYAALIAVFCLAEIQPHRGRFRSMAYLRALLGKRGRHLPFLAHNGDVVELADKRVYVDGWDEWQEGDWKVGERVARIRNRPRPGASPGSAAATSPVTPDVTVGVTVGAVTDGTVATVAVDSVGRLSAGGSAGAGGSGNGILSSEEDRSKPLAEPERADVQALLDRGWKRVTVAQRRVLDEVLDRHDVTGPAWAARIIAETPSDGDPLAAVKRADSEWQRVERDRADRSDAHWASEKRAERQGAPARLAEIVGR